MSEEKQVEEIEKRRKVSSIVKETLDFEKFQELHWEGSFEEYLEIVYRNPKVVRNSFQRLYDMIMSYRTEEYSAFKQKLVHYKFFDDPFSNGKDAIFGLDTYLMKLVDVIKAAARGYGPERRIVLLHGPVGSSKSTIVRLFKRGLEEYSKTPEGAIYSYYWRIDNEDGSVEMIECPMRSDPLKLIPEGSRKKVFAELNLDGGEEDGSAIHIEGDLCPVCRFYYNRLMERYKGDWGKVISQVRVKRLVLSEKDRVGIGTFQPKDEKNQDSTELTGDINYRKIAIYGSDSDPRAFNFDGELNVANRGIVEFIEILKLDVAFLYDLLGATQEHKIKPKKFSQVDIDEVIIGHTNEPEYKKLLNNEYMEALRDRTIKIDIPYIMNLTDEIKIYERDFKLLKGKHIAPHTLEIAAMWAVLTRLEEPKKAGVTLMQKLKLYDGRLIPGYTEDTIKELRKEAEREGMEGISPRYIQDKISNALVSDVSRKCVNPFMVMSEIEGGLAHHSLISSEAQRRRFRELLALVRQEYEEIIKNEVQRAIAADEEAIARLCGNYIDNIKAYVRREKVKNPFTGEDEEPDERLMRSIEEKIDIPESRKDDFRREIMNYIAALALEGKKFDYAANERLRRALELKLFEDQKDSIKLTSLVTNVIDKATQEKIEIVKSRLIRDYGYCASCSNDVLTYVASIFARGDIKESRERRR